MKKIQIIELPNAIRAIDGSIILMDAGDNKLDVDMPDYWSMDTERKYKRVTNKLDNISARGKGYFIYVWYDISGYDYWVKRMKEDNYAQISIEFDQPEIKTSQIPALIKKIQSVINKVEAIITI